LFHNKLQNRSILIRQYILMRNSEQSVTSTNVSQIWKSWRRMLIPIRMTRTKWIWVMYAYACCLEQLSYHEMFTPIMCSRSFIFDILCASPFYVTYIVNMYMKNIDLFTTNIPTNSVMKCNQFDAIPIVLRLDAYLYTLILIKINIDAVHERYCSFNNAYWWSLA
jgi:hypothetical protein